MLNDNGLFKQLAGLINKTSHEKGFWSSPEMMDKYVAKLGLIHSEATEILEALRKSKGASKVTEEFADLFIRGIDLHTELAKVGLATSDLFETIVEKMTTNAGRPILHNHKWG